MSYELKIELTRSAAPSPTSEDGVKKPVKVNLEEPNLQARESKG